MSTCVGQCSVTCGEGQQRREVFCMGAGGEHLDDHACSGLTKPASVRTCRRPACQTHTTWHVTDYGLVGEIKLGRLTYLCYIYSLFSHFCSALEAVVVVLGRGKWAALIQIWIPTQRPGVDWLTGPPLWRHATHSPAPERKVSQIFNGCYMIWSRVRF